MLFYIPTAFVVIVKKNTNSFDMYTHIIRDGNI